MNTERHFIEVADLPVEVVRKEIKNLHVAVYPPSGRVRVAAPPHMDDTAVRLAVVTRLPWIRQKQKAFAVQQRQSQREMVSGESHFFQGRRYLLEVVERPEPPSVQLVSNTKIRLQVRPGADRDGRQKVLHHWYRSHLRQQIPALVEKWEPRIGETVADVRIRRMKTRWGSCNAAARRILLNLELAKKPTACLEYILVHEMVHFLERHHTDRFRELMDTFMPSWRQHRDELNRAPLAHEDWRY